MKKFSISVVLITAIVLSQSQASFAASTSSSPITVSAGVQGNLSLQVIMKANNFSGATISAMNFGDLVLRGGNLVSSPAGTTGIGAVDVFLIPITQGLPYTITQTGTALSNGTTNLPAGACAVTPVYAPEDNSGLTLPTGASVGTPGTWVSVNKTIYTSGTTGAVFPTRVVQAFYSITDDPAAGATSFVPNSQPAGNYVGTVVFTLTTL